MQVKLVDGGGGGDHGDGGSDDVHEVCQGGQVGVGGPPVQPPAEEEPGTPTLLLWLHHQPFVSIWYLKPFLHRRREPTCELRKRPRKRLGSDKVDPPLSMCSCVSFFLQDVNAEFRRLIIRWPSFELEQ